MKTSKLSMGRGGRYAILTAILLMVSITTSATDYKIYVYGKQVTSSNCNDVLGDGKVKYNNSTKTLTITNETLSRTGSNNDIIANKSENSLIVELYGNNTFTASGCAPVRCFKSSSVTLKVMTGTTTLQGNNGGIYISETTCSLQTEEDANLNVLVNNSEAIVGNNSKSDNNLCFGSGYFFISGEKGDLVNLDLVYFSPTTGKDLVIDLYTTGSDSYPIVKNVKAMEVKSCSTATYNEKVENGNYYIECSPAILDPAGAYFSSSQKSIVDSYGPLCCETVIRNDYAAVVNSNFFPDANFRSYLRNKYGDYITREQENQTTELKPNNEYISSLEGIKFFTHLKYLHCNGNYLTSLNLGWNTNLVEVQCVSNNLTSLQVPSKLKYLFCENNQLASLNLSYCTNLIDVTCYNNKLTSLQLPTNYTTFRSLDCSDNQLPYLSFSQAPNLETLNCSRNKITNLYVTQDSKLYELLFDDNASLTSVEIRNNPRLEYLRLSGLSSLTTALVYSNALETLELSGVPNLKKLNCYNNKFTELNVQGFSNLSYLDCSSNPLMTALYCTSNALTTLKLEGCTALKTLYCSYNKFTALNLNDVMDTLEELYCMNNSLTSLNVVNLNHLKTLNCGYNSNLSSIVLPYLKTSLETLYCGFTVIPSLDVSGYKNLKQLECLSNTSLTSVNVTGCTKLEGLTLFNNRFTSLNLSTNTALKSLMCCYNPNITSLDVSACKNLMSLDCSGDELTSLDLTGLNSMEQLLCHQNKLSTLILPQSPNLKKIYCYDNNLRGAGMDAVFATLPDRSDKTERGEIDVYSSSGNDNNVCYAKHVNTARNKNWDVYYYAQNAGWILYDGAPIPTDIHNPLDSPSFSAGGGSADEQSPIYNLSGQRVGSGYKGIVVKNGKKVRQ